MTAPHSSHKNTINPNRDLPIIPTACLLLLALALRLHHPDRETLATEEQRLKMSGVNRLIHVRDGVKPGL